MGKKGTRRREGRYREREGLRMRVGAIGQGEGRARDEQGVVGPYVLKSEVEMERRKGDGET